LSHLLGSAFEGATVTIVRYLVLTVPSVIVTVCVVAGCSASPGAALSFALLAYAVAFAVYQARLEEQLGPPTHWTDRIGAVAVPMLCAGTGATAAVMAVAGLCVICGAASPAVLTALVLVAAVPLWRRWGCPALVIVVTQTPGRIYLDELERRDPAGVARWLDSGARAGGNPSKFLTPARSLGEFHDDNSPATDHRLTD
jgi:hypothetical protein